MKKENPELKCLPNGPYNFIDCTIKNSKEKIISEEANVYLCRCGGSSNKPFCDGTHMKNNFSDKKLTDGAMDKRIHYQGKEIIIHDNRGICAHSGFCTNGLPSVFKLNKEPWIEPYGATAGEIIDTVKKCPSGALSYSIKGVEYRDNEGEPAVKVTKDGPYAVSGSVKLSKIEQGEDASEEHYTLCRCGGSKNKPFCDGTHWHIGFKDDSD